MFLKPFRTKSSVTVRNSDRRKVKSRLGSFFPEMTEDQIGNLIPAKGDLKENKIYTHKGEGLSVFTYADEPVLIELSSGTLIPYLYSIWKLELILPTLYVPSYLLEKFSGGADLMAPGIIIPPGLGIDQTIVKHKAAIIKIIGQKHAVAVGYAEQSGSEMANGKLSGKAIKIVSVIGDQLWTSGSKFVPPSEPDPIFVGKVIPDEENDCEETNTVDGEEIELLDNNETEEVQEDGTNKEVEETPEHEIDIDVLSPEQIRKEQDDLLEYTFKAAIKTKLQNDKDKMPILCSTFYSQMMLTSVPNGKKLEIKKTSMKKLSPYLNQKMTEGVLKIEKAAKGVETIASVNFKHNLFRGFASEVVEEVLSEPTKLVEVMGAMSTKDAYAAPVITQLYANSGQTKNIFNEVGVSNSAVMSMKELREHVTKYVDQNQLRWRNMVKLDPHLHKCVFGKGKEEIEEVTWDKVFGGVQAKTNPAYSIQFPGQHPHIRKGKLPKLNIQIKRVSGNKSVTLVTGFEGFMIDENYFGDLMKKRAQASISIGPDLTGKFIQVQIQGNQTKHVQHIICDNFKIDKKYITGLENAKPGKKK